MPRGKNKESFNSTSWEGAESDEEMKKASPKQPAPAGAPSARGAKRGQAVDEAIDVDEPPGRHPYKAKKHHGSPVADDDVPSAGDEDLGANFRAPLGSSAFGASCRPATRSNVSSKQVSPLVAPLRSPKAQSRAPDPAEGESAKRARTPSWRSVEAQQQNAEAAAAKESAARRRKGASPPKSQYADAQEDEQGEPAVEPAASISSRMSDAKRELADGEESEAKRSSAHVRHEAASVLAPVSSDLSRWDDSDASGLKSALQDVTLIDAAWLANLADNGGILPRWQELPAEAKVALAEMEQWDFGPEGEWLPVLVISYPWLDRDHPDMAGELLRRVAFVLKAFASSCDISPGSKVGVFWDYASLPQRSRSCPKGADDRTPAERARFERALDNMGLWYSHPKTFVLLVSTSLPEGDYTNCAPYGARGWCMAERHMSAMVKGTGLLLDLSQLTGAECDIMDMMKTSSARQPPPLTPTAFAEKLRDGVSSKRIAFTNGGDVDVVAEIYQRAFTTEFGSTRRLCFQHRAWSEAQGEAFAAALRYALSDGGLKHVEALELENNRIGDQSIIALVDACQGDNVMPRCAYIYLDRNDIGDAGMRALASAIERNTWPLLEKVTVDRNPRASSEARETVDAALEQLKGRRALGGTWGATSAL